MTDPSSPAAGDVTPADAPPAADPPSAPPLQPDPALIVVSVRGSEDADQPGGATRVTFQNAQEAQDQ